MESSVHLTLANFVLRNKLQTCAPESVSFLISDFLIADLPLAGACQLSRAESIALLNLVWMRSQRDNHSDTWSNARLLQTEPRYNRWAFCKTLSQAVEKKDSVLIQWVLQHFPNLPITETIVRKVAENGLLWLLQQLQSERPRRRIGWGKTSYLDAAKAREWEVVHWLLPRCHVSQRFKKQDAQLVLQALDQNNLRELKWVLSLGFTMKHLKLVDPPIHPQLRAIVEAKSLEHGRRGPTDTLETQWRDRTVLVRYLVENGIMPFKNIAEISWRPAARYGDLEFMKWLASKSGSTRRAASNISLVEALKAAADNGHVAIAKWLLGNFRGLVESRALSEAVFLAANGGNLEIVRWLCDKYSSDQGLRLFLKHDAYLSDDELEDEDEENNLSDEIDSNDNGQWNDHGDRRSEAPYKQKPPIQATAMDVAAKNGHLSVLEFLQSVNTTPSNEQQHNGGERGRGGRGGRGGRAGGKRKKAKRQRGRTPYCTTAAMDLAAAAGYLSIVQWLHSNRREGCTKMAMDRAAANGHLEVVKWLHLNRLEGCTTRAINAASTRCNAREPDEENSSFATPQDESRFEIIQFLHSNRFEGCTFAAMDGAAGNGNRTLLQWLHTHMRPRCSPAAMDNAAGEGYLNIVKWLHQNRKEGCSSKAMDQAAAGGHLEVVQWLHDNREEGCTPAAIDGAAANRNFKVVKWLCENRDEGYTASAMEDAAQNGDLEMVKLLHEINPDLLLDIADDEFLDEFSDEEPTDCVQMVNNLALDAAASNGHLNVVRWLDANCKDLDIVPAMEDPITNGHFEVLLYLHSALGGVYSAYDLNEVWDSLQEETYLESNEELVAWFTENYPRPDEEDVERELELVDNMDGMDNAELLGVYLDAAFGRVFLR